jgi:hypothetical protein
MARIAVFTEGQSELIITRHLLTHLSQFQNIEIKCFRLRGENLDPRPYSIKNGEPRHFFQIINVENDEKVLSFISERLEQLVNANYDFIVGLKDMYGEQYKKFSSKIDAAINSKFVDGHKNTIDSLGPHSDKVKLFFSIMEIEAWLLSMPNVFSKIDKKLTIDNIRKVIGVDLSTESPEKTFFHPKMETRTIFASADMSYKPSSDETERIVAMIDDNEILEGLREGFSPSFMEFYRFLEHFFIE